MVNPVAADVRRRISMAVHFPPPYVGGYGRGSWGQFPETFVRALTSSNSPSPVLADALSPAEGEREGVRGPGSWKEMVSGSSTEIFLAKIENREMG
jgi:hypothetical protein